MPSEGTPRPGVSIRRAVPEDASSLTAIALASKASLGYDEALLDLWRTQLTVSPEYIAEHRVLCACLRGKPIGFSAAVSLREEAFELEHLWIQPGHMRRGIGRRLLEALTADLRQTGARSLRIVSDPSAEGFYTQMGAQRVGSVESTPRGRVLPELLLELQSTESF